MSQQPKFSVYMIESPSGDDHYHRRTEAHQLSQGLSLIGIRSEFRTVSDCRLLSTAISECASMVASGWSPMALHISTHGAEHGIQLTSGEVIDWAQLGRILGPLSEATRGDLLLCMSSCEGFSGIQMAMTTGEEPFSVIVGPLGKPTYSDTTVAFLTMYHLIAKGYGLPAAVDAMNKAAGHAFGMVTGAEVKNKFLQRFEEPLPLSSPEQQETIQ